LTAQVPGRAWLGVCAAAALLALAAWPLPRDMLDWQPSLALAEPWRLFTAAGVHWSPMHLGANLLGVAVVAWFGVAGRLPAAPAMAWLAAWPLTHAGLMSKPDLAHYGGLSGVLHAAVAAGACWLVLAARGRRRAVGAAVVAGVGLKLLAEAPWGPPLRTVSGWDIPLAPLAHATGAAAGLACSGCAWLAARRPREAAA
jgi:rhomboid family GlyGly-CTERM serine protease